MLKNKYFGLEVKMLKVKGIVYSYKVKEIICRYKVKDQKWLEG